MCRLRSFGAVADTNGTPSNDAPHSIEKRIMRPIEPGATMRNGSSGLGYGRSPHVGRCREVGYLVEQGMSNGDAIRAATSGAAELCGAADETGSIQPGMEADLILIDRNPLDDIRSLQDLLAVISNGTVVVNRLTTIDGRPPIP